MARALGPRRAGRTGDTAGSAAAHVEGFLTKGILDPLDYYRRVFADAVRAVEAVASLDRVDPTRIAVAGTSQGGGIALAAAALADPVAAAIVNVPFLCHPRRAVEVADQPPYAELLAFLRTHRTDGDLALETLTYFDGVNMASRATAPALFSVALMDEVCTPSSVYAAYNHYAGPKMLEVYPRNGHEGGGVAQDELTIAWLRQQPGRGAILLAVTRHGFHLLIRCLMYCGHRRGWRGKQPPRCGCGRRDMTR